MFSSQSWATELASVLSFGHESAECVAALGLLPSSAMTAVWRVSATPNYRNPSYPSEPILHGRSPNRPMLAKYVSLQVLAERANHALKIESVSLGHSCRMIGC